MSLGSIYSMLYLTFSHLGVDTNAYIAAFRPSRLFIQLLSRPKFPAVLTKQVVSHATASLCLFQCSFELVIVFEAFVGE